MAKKKNTPQVATVTGGNLFIRLLPDMRASRIGVLDNGTKVDVLKVKGDWAEIPQGYIMTEFLEFEHHED